METSDNTQGDPITELILNDKSIFTFSADQPAGSFASLYYSKRFFYAFTIQWQGYGGLTKHKTFYKIITKDK